jgi:hypothetical protein
MPQFLMISKHSPENCPMVHEKPRKAYVDWFNKLDEWSKKYKIKTLWAGGVMSEHLSIFIFEAPSLEVFEKASMEPESLAMMATETTEVKLAMSMDSPEAIKMMKEWQKGK